MRQLLAAIVKDDRASVSRLLKADRELVNQTASEAKLYEKGILHWLYMGDTALHLAAAGYRVEIARRLLAAGAEVNAAANHRGGTPLHYAADGSLTSSTWNEARQIATLEALIGAGANIHAQDKNGASALHRAVRHRCAAAVRLLLEAGCDPALRNHPGSTCFHLAVHNTGAGGSGAEAAHVAQRQIIREFISRGVSTGLKDGKGQTVLECARSEWVRELVTSSPPPESRRSSPRG